MAEPPVPEKPGAPPAPYTLRVTFTYRGGEIALAGGRRVRMIAAAPAPADSSGARTGYWFELRDASGALLFHRALHDPIRADVEVFANDRAESIARVAVAEPQGEFELLVPDLPDARTFTLFGPPVGERLRGTPSKPLLDIALDELRREPPSAGPEPPKPDQGPR